MGVSLEPIDLTAEVDRLILRLVPGEVSRARERAAVVDAPALGVVLPSAGAIAAAAALKPSVEEGTRLSPAEIMAAQEEELEDDARRAARRWRLRSGI